MKTKKSLNDLLRELRALGEIPFSLLDEVLARPGALGPELPRWIAGVGQADLLDDRVSTRLRAAQPGGRTVESELQRFVTRARILSADEEQRLGKRVEFTRRRLERTIVCANVPDDQKEELFEAIETTEVVRLTPGHCSRAETADAEALERRRREFYSQRNELIESHLPLLEKIAARYRTYGIPPQDLVQHGSLGLIRAADKFDWRKGVRFRTYAEWWIRQAIERATDTDRDIIHVPRPMRQKLSKANYLNRLQNGGQPLDARRFAELTGVDQLAAARAMNIKSGIASLERASFDDGPTLREELIGPDLSMREERESDEYLRTRVTHLLDVLPDREQRVIRLRYGLRGEQEHTLEEVGEILHISRERVRQLQARALDHLRSAKAEAVAATGS